MKLLFTKNNTIFSKLIRYGLKEPVSHVVLQFNNGTIIHSDSFGVSIQWSNDYLKKNKVLFSIDYKVNVSDEEIIEHIMNNVASRSYDFAAVMYFTWSVLLYKISGKWKTHNEWNDKNNYMCTEMVQLLPGKIQDVLEGYDLSITSPYKLYNILKLNIDIINSPK